MFHLTKKDYENFVSDCVNAEKVNSPSTQNNNNETTTQKETQKNSEKETTTKKMTQKRKQWN